MIRKKWVDMAAVFGIMFALLVSITLAYFPQVFALESKGVTKQYQTQLFDKDAIMTVDILMSDEDWQEMLDNAMAEEYYCCDVVINGVTYKNVGIRPKGNTSLSQIASDDTTDRYSFKLEFDQYDSTQTCMGLDKLVLNSMMSDATYRKEYLAYDIMEYLGVDTSLYSYASVSRNGENWGLYFALEGMEEAYAERVFGSSYGELYKPESLGGGGGFGGSQGSDLAYIDDNTDSYSVIFDAAVFEPTEQDKERVVEALKHISEGTDLEKYVDTDAMLRYIASNTFLVNDDSYFGNMLHNYYLYEEDGRLTMLPWDYNLAFGGFQSQNAGSLINRGIDDVVSGSLAERPMIASLLAVEEYKEQYYELLEELVSGYFESGYFTELMDKLDIMLDSYVAEDTTAFYTYDEYVEAKETLRTFCEKRAESVRKQLDGSLAKTASAQESSAKVDAGGINVALMGTMGGGKGGMREAVNMEFAGGRGGFGGNMQPPEGMELPDGMQPPEGMELPENMQMPEGMEAPENMQMPEGEGLSEEKTEDSLDEKQGAATERATVSDGQENTPENSGESFREDRGEKGGFPNGEFHGNFPDGFPGAETKQSGTDGLLWLGISAAVMLAGLLFARFYPRSRY